jgi:hypothetical protein
MDYNVYVTEDNKKELYFSGCKCDATEIYDVLTEYYKYDDIVVDIVEPETPKYSSFSEFYSVQEFLYTYNTMERT